MSLLVLGGFCGAHAQQPDAGGLALPPLPAVQDEGTTGAEPVLAPLGQGAGAPAATPAPKGRFASEVEARERIREAFANRDYSAVLGIAREIHKQFPTATFVGFYETTARLQMRELDVDAGKIPYRRMATLPASRRGAATTSATVAAAPGQSSATAAQAASPSAAQAAPAPTAASTPEPVATPVPAAAAPAPPPGAKPSMRERLSAMFQDNRNLFFYSGGGALVLLALMGLFVRRRRTGHPEEDGFENALGEPAGPMMVTEAAPKPAEAPAYFRSEVQAMANGWAASMQAPAAAPVLEEEEAPAAPEPEPVFALATEDEPVAAAPATAPRMPVTPTPEPLLDDSEIVFDDEIFEPEPSTKSFAQPAAPEPEEDSLLMVAETPDYAEGQVGESLYIDEDVSQLEYPSNITIPLRAQAPEPEPEVISFGLREESTVRDGEPAAETVPMSAEELPEEATETAWPEPEADAEATVISGPGPDESVSETPEFQTFHPDQTVTIHVDAEQEEAPPAEPARAAAPMPEKKERKVEPQDVPEDVFEREYQAGMKDIQARNWVGAIHHLSIAAALRPGVPEVKEQLREARRLRAKELEGRG